MSRLFYESIPKSIEELLIDKWDVSKVTRMKAMFKGCNCLYLCPNSLMYWNVSKVTDMSEMFSGCVNVKIPVHKYWRIDENMVNTDKMFENSGVQ